MSDIEIQPSLDHRRGQGSFSWADPLLLDDQLTTEERMIRDAAAAFAEDKLRPRVETDYMQELTDRDIFREMGASGLLGVPIPEEYGGAGASYVAYGLVARGIERVDSGYRSMMSVQSSLVMHPIHAYGTDDLIDGTGDDDEIWAGRGDDDADGRGGDDIIHCGGGDDLLDAGRGSDRLHGEGGKDLLDGGLGRDLLKGGAGADSFVFDSAADSSAGDRRDTVYFERRQGDAIDLSGIDADDSSARDHAFDWIGARDFSGKECELRFTGRILAGDTDGDGRADFQILVEGALSAADVIL